MHSLILLTALGGVACPPQGFFAQPRPVSRVPYATPVAPAAPMPAAGPSAAIPEKSLYERLGGEPAIKAVVTDLVGRLAANPKVNVTRKGVDGARTWEPTPENVAKLDRLLFQLVCHVTGGPQKYEGRSMLESHKGLKITEAEFNAAAADLKVTLDKFNVPAREQAELFKIIESTRKDIVQSK
jgi:hemoglobin